MGKQMTSGQHRMVHPSTSKTTWRSIDWDKAWREVRRLQMRIAKAAKEENYGKVKALQWILSHSFYAKALAVKRVTSNKGKKTPGVDGVIWKGSRAKMQAVFSLRQHGYKAQPLRRIYIPKKDRDKKRPLSIPTMHDRAMQALYKLALIPVAEITADGNSYGFREGRSCADAVAAAFNALSKPNSATWVLEGDITGCYDNISKSWLMENIPVEKRILRQWLSAGYVENGITYPTRKGTPQGGIVSPCLANMTLDGLQEAVRKAVPWRSRVNFIRYADDFIITAKSRAILQRYVMPAVKRFLAKRGLALSDEKTKITYIRDGFTFLGKYTTAPIVILIKKLNEILRGWANYHRHVVASEAFERVDNYVYEQLWRMLRRRHSKRSKKWLIKKYWTASGKKGIFARIIRYGKRLKLYQVLRVGSIVIRRHRKIIAKANPYLPEYVGYYCRRKWDKESKLLRELTARQMRLAL
jgi:RNA-directed DNA polymerase